MDYYASASADNIRFARSKIIMAPADGLHNVIRVPSKAFLLDTFIQVVAPYSSGSTGAITVGLVGEVNDPDGLLVDTYINSEAAGISRASGGSAAYSEGYWFQKSGAISITTAKGDSSADIACVVFAFFSVLH